MTKPASKNQSLATLHHQKVNAPVLRSPVKQPNPPRLPFGRKLARQKVCKITGRGRVTDAMIIHSDGARQFDTAFEHSLCWFHASRPMAKLIPVNKKERAARDWIEKQYWHLYDDIEAYCQVPTAAWKEQIRQDFNHWVTTMVDYPDLRYELGKLHRAREELLLVLEHPWLPMHNNLSERQIREYVKRRKISGGTRSDVGQRCRDTFASLKKTCKLHGLSFSRYLKDRTSGAGVIPRLSDIVREKSAQLMGSTANSF